MRRRARRAGQRGESTLWSVAMITSCVMLIGVVVVTVWVSRSGGRLGEVALALSGIGRHFRGEPPVAALEVPTAEPTETAAPSAEPSSVPSASPSADPTANVLATEEGDGGTDDTAEEEEDEPDAGGPTPKVTPHQPQPPSKAASAPKKKKKPRKKRR